VVDCSLEKETTTEGNSEATDTRLRRRCGYLLASMGILVEKRTKARRLRSG
jgi:hypothetical protein